MLDAHLMHKRHRHLIARVMIDKTNLFLHPLRLQIAIIITAPNRTHTKINKTMTDNLPSCLRHITPPPERLAQPVTQLTLIITIRHTRMTIKL